MSRTANAILVGVVFCGQLAWAQVTGGTISGVVRDESGAVVPGVAVTTKNLGTGMTRQVSTDAQGRYQAPNLPLGNYEVQAVVSGFQTAVRTGITLMVGQEAAVDFTLRVGEVTTRVEVTGEAPLVEATRSDVSGVVEPRQVSELPLNGRSFLQLAQLQVGVVSAARNAGDLSFGGKAQTLATAGAQATSGLFLLDGSDIGDYMFAQSPGGASGLAIGVDLIREFRVLTNSFSAEYGRTSGGVMTVVTKSGTNKLEGTAFWFHRNDNLDARNFFDGPRVPEFKRNQFGGTVGGPIVQDKSFFLGSYEGLREALGRTGVAIVPNALARQGILPAGLGGNVGVAPGVKPFLDQYYPLPTGQDFGNGAAELRSVASQPIREDFFSVRVDHNFWEKDSLFGRYTFRDGVRIDPFNSTSIPGFPAVGEQRTQYMSLEETHVFSPTVVNTFRVSYNRNKKNNPVAPVPQELSISLIPNRGLGQIQVGGVSTPGYSFAPAFSRLNVYQAQDTVNFTRGRHSLKAGVELLRYQIYYDFPANFYGFYSFLTLADFLSGRADTDIYTGALPGSSAYRSWRWYSYAFFVQDEFRVLPNLTLNLGLRYEPYTNPNERTGSFATLIDPLKDTNLTSLKSLFGDSPGAGNLMPRFGFAWDPFSNGKLAIRGGFGVFFDRVQANLFRGNLNPPTSKLVTIQGAPFPNPLVGGGSVSPSLLNLVDQFPYNNFSYPYAMQWNFGVEKQIVPSTVVTASYVGSRGVHLNVRGNLNLNQWLIQPDGRKFFPVGAQPLNPAFGSIDAKEPQGNSSYHSFQLSLKRRWSQGLQFQLAYTLSKSIDNGTTFSTTGQGNTPNAMIDLFDPKLDRGLSPLDERHNLVFNSSYELPFGRGSKWLGGWQVGGIVSLVSGVPFTVNNGFDRARSSRVRTVSGSPDRVKTVKVESRNVDRYFDLSAYQLQPAGFFGNGGRNSVIGPGLASVDFSVLKNTSITERVNVQWRAEIFNLFNRANFATPGDGTGGRAGGTAIFTSASGIPVPTAGKILKTVTTSRQIQFGLKLVF